MTSQTGNENSSRIEPVGTLGATMASAQNQTVSFDTNVSSARGHMQSTGALDSNLPTKVTPDRLAHHLVGYDQTKTQNILTGFYSL